MKIKKLNKERAGFNNPQTIYILVNFGVNFIVFFFVIGVFPFANSNPIKKYIWPFLIYQIIWILLGVSFKKYLSFRKRSIGTFVDQCFKSDFFASTVGIGLVLLFLDLHYSVSFLLVLSCSCLGCELILISLIYAFGEAQLVEVSVVLPNTNTPAINEYPSHPLNAESIETLEILIRKAGGTRLLDFLRINICPFVSSTLYIETASRFNIEKIYGGRYSSIVDFKVINEIREINAFFAAVNDKLPVGGIFIACFETKSQRKRRILGGHPSLDNYLHYGFDFLLRRIGPKLNLTREFYFWITNGTNRVLSKAEVFGRLYYSGFEVISQRKIKGLTYVVAHKNKVPQRDEVLNYSSIIKLKRLGKDGKIITVYKLRTMHPYSEYLQDYIYKHHQLHESGKFNTDIRITTLGRFLRRYWLDELPMMANFLKRDLKLVGVRPLSEHYFNLYSSDIQTQRLRHRPGLLPPYYADMPKTLNEIQASEKRYLDACEKHGTFITDVRYFFKIIYRIIFGQARSR
ncbi:sugar transferase [Microbacter margulisiae]|uniref:Lipopolysaccharide/colanic/teichoic acid biosynthesis glycosyltransferase n=1 Tax=Microbacter margulisiae TaxID=1350067 RepID=A0A7W5DS32_9PORP|nr:sugar transferase [Microbacter margulisiae]MBB3188035.1 lipopolysaccharide/colanic/teichoic acid biosynthesis glycosyltransferase [Microbacter margulisiae]